LSMSAMIQNDIFTFVPFKHPSLDCEQRMALMTWKCDQVPHHLKSLLIPVAWDRRTLRLVYD
jgi:hypothetical protein